MIDDKKNYFVCVAKNDAEMLGYLIACDIKKLEIDFIQEIFTKIFTEKLDEK